MAGSAQEASQDDPAIEAPVVSRQITVARPLRRKDVGSAYGLALGGILLPVAGGILAGHSTPPLALAASELPLLALAILFVLLKRQGLIDGLRWRMVRPGLLIRAMVLGITGWGMVSCVAYATDPLIEWMVGADPCLGSARPESFGELALLLLAGAVLPGICEETLFRGGVQGVLERLGPWKAVVYTSLFFAAFHLTPWRLVYPFALGLLMGVVTLRTGSILPAMVIHACNNATCESVHYLHRGCRTNEIGGANTEHGWWILPVTSAVLFVPVLLEFLRHTRNLRPRPSGLIAVPADMSMPARWVVGVIAFILAAAAALLLAGRMAGK